MKKILLAFSLVAILSACNKESVDPIIGKWKLKTIVKGAVSIDVSKLPCFNKTTFEFKSGGSVILDTHSPKNGASSTDNDCNNVKIENGVWKKLSGDDYEMTNSNTREVEKVKVTFKGKNTMIIDEMDKDSEKVTLERL